MCRWRVPFVARDFGGSHKVQMCDLARVGGGDIGVLRVSSGVQKRKGEGEADVESGVRGVEDDGSGVRKEAPGVLTANKVILRVPGDLLMVVVGAGDGRS